ncbi:MAG TPA: hypothetical protein V6C98_15205 [Thermosynechococcaceae cyanobacterium]
MSEAKDLPFPTLQFFTASPVGHYVYYLNLPEKLLALRMAKRHTQGLEC